MRVLALAEEQRTGFSEQSTYPSFFASSGRRQVHPEGHSVASTGATTMSIQAQARRRTMSLRREISLLFMHSHIHGRARLRALNSTSRCHAIKISLPRGMDVSPV
jgi:hypothetical protein